MLVIRSSQVPAQDEPDSGDEADPLREQAAELFAEQLVTDQVPSIRAIRAQLHVGRLRAQRLNSVERSAPADAIITTNGPSSERLPNRTDPACAECEPKRATLSAEMQISACSRPFCKTVAMATRTCYTGGKVTQRLEDSGGRVVRRPARNVRLSPDGSLAAHRPGGPPLDGEAPIYGEVFRRYPPNSSPGFLEVIGELNPLKTVKDGVTEN